MDKILSDLIIGIVGGLIATFLTLVVRKYWLAIVVPWYEERVYQDVKFEGRWYGYATISGKDVDRIWEISRQGHNFVATVTSTSGSDKGQVFHVNGSFKNLILTGTYTHTDAGNTARGTYAFKLVGDGRKFQGGIAYYSTSKEKIEYGSYMLVRPEDTSCATTRPAPTTMLDKA